MKIEARLAELGIVLPVASSPSNSYVAVKHARGLVFVAGHNPKKDGKCPYLGKVGDTVTLEAGPGISKTVCSELFSITQASLGQVRSY